MPATVIQEHSVAGPYVREGDAALTTLTMTATDPTNKNKAVLSTGRALVLFCNTDGANHYWATVEGTNDPYGRTATTGQHSLAAGAWAARIFDAPGWEQNLGSRDLQFDTENAAVVVAIIPL